MYAGGRDARGPSKSLERFQAPAPPIKMIYGELP